MERYAKYDEDQNERASTSYASKFFSVCISLIIGLLLYIFSTQPRFYGDETSCIYLRQYSYILGLGTLIVCGIQIAIILYCCVTNNIKWFIIAELIDFLYFIYSLVLWIMLWVALSKDEDCGQLDTLVWIFTWIIVGVFSLGFCIAIYIVVAVLLKQ